MSHAQGPDETQLIQRAKNGDPSARVDVAFNYEAAGNADMAAHWMDAAAATGDPFAKMQRAAWKLYGTNFERDEHAALLDIREVAERGGEANARTFLAVLLAYGTGCERNWREAVSWIRREASTGHARCMLQLALLQPDIPACEPLIQKLLACAASLDGSGSPVQINASDIDAAATNAAACDAADWRPTASRVVSERPRVDVFSGVAPERWCRHVIRTARPMLHGAHVKDAQSGRRIRDPMRTNTVALIELWQSDLIFYSLAARIASATGDPVNRQEPPNILNYRPGETYQAHFDFIDPTVPFFQNELREQGQRTKTPLIYLNDNYEGGATEFPAAQREYKAASGDLLVLCNTDPEGNPDQQSLHVGAPPTTGEKWVFSTRIRTKPQLARVWPEI